MFKRMSRAETAITPMPGRNWHSYIGPQTAPTTHLSMGVSVYEPGARPTGHVHEAAEETVYCVSGRGRLVCDAGPHPGRNIPRHRVRRPRADRTALCIHSAGCARLLREEPEELTRRSRPWQKRPPGSRLGNQTNPAIWRASGDEGPRRSRQSQGPLPGGNRLVLRRIEPAGSAGRRAPMEL